MKTVSYSVEEYEYRFLGGPLPKYMDEEWLKENNWLSVSDDLPLYEEEVEFVMLNDFSKIEKARIYRINFYEDKKIRWMSEKGVYNDVHITHWRKIEKQNEDILQ